MSPTLAQRRRAARRAWHDAAQGLSDGWSILAADLTPILSAFEVELRPGLELVAIVYSWDRDGEGRTLALRVDDAERLRESGLPDDFEDADEPDFDLVGDAIDLGDALEGDASHLLAAIAVRELRAVVCEATAAAGSTRRSSSRANCLTPTPRHHDGTTGAWRTPDRGLRSSMRRTEGCPCASTRCAGEAGGRFAGTSIASRIPMAIGS